MILPPIGLTIRSGGLAGFPPIMLEDEFGIAEERGGACFISVARR